MVSASDLKEGVIVKREGNLFKVVVVETKTGTAQFSSHIFLKLKNLQTSNVIELRVDPEEKFEDVEVEEVEMEYLYTDGENFYFMHPETFEQSELTSHMIGDFSDFLKEGTKIKVEMFEGKPVSVVIPEFVELKVETTGAGVKGGTDNTWKSATLENGMEILVPQFIKEGDIVKVSTKTKEYVERVHK